MNSSQESLLPLLHVLAAALSHSPEIRAASLKQLQTWSVLPGFYSSLVEIFANKTLDLGQDGANIMLQAAVQFKNGVDRYWRRGAIHAISADERRAIKPQLLTMVNEPNRVLAKTVALSIAKIARVDYGTEWDELPHSLLHSLQVGMSNSSHAGGRRVLHRTLMFLHASVKLLSSNRMLKGVYIMATFGNLVLPILNQVYRSSLDYELRRFRAGEPVAIDEGVGHLEIALLAFKTLSKIFVYGSEKSADSSLANSFFISTLPDFESVLEIRYNFCISAATSSRSSSTSSDLKVLTKLVTSYTKFYRTSLEHDSARFLRMGNTDAILKAYWKLIKGAAASESLDFTDVEQNMFPQKVVVQAILLMKATMGDWASKSPVDISTDFVRPFAELLTTRFLPLTSTDLEQWAHDPEEFMNEEEADRWEFDLRPCAEHVLQSLMSNYAEELAPLMANLLEQVSGTCSGDKLLLKEAVYCVFGRNASVLRNAIDFDSWLGSSLVSEATSIDPSYRIIRRRIAWLVGSWIGEDPSPDTQAKIYSILVHLLGRNASTDTAIRLSAARSLAKCDTWDFEASVFLPFLPEAIHEISLLLSEVETADSQMRLNQTLGMICDRVGVHIAPYAGQLATTLANLWNAALEPLFQTSVLVTFTKLAEALGGLSQGLLSQCCPIIRTSINPTLPSHVYLQEDGLELWQVLLRRTKIVESPALELLPMLVNLIAAGTDVLPRTLKILESYLLLDATQVLGLICRELFVALEGLIGELRLEAVKSITHALSTVFRMAPMEAWALALDETRLFHKLLVPLAAKDEPALIASKYLCTTAHIVLAGPVTFLQLVHSTASRAGESGNVVLHALLTEWTDKLDCMSQPGQRKLVALALAYLMSTSDPVVLQHIGEIFSVWSSVMAETEEDDSGDAEIYVSLDGGYDSGVDGDCTETPEQSRREDLLSRDPVHTVKLVPMFKKTISLVQSTMGPHLFQNDYLSRVDPLILEELSKRIEGSLKG